MFIAFEGPDKAGKSTSAATLATGGQAIYNATKKLHELERARLASEGAEHEVVTYDRIDWLTHMVYRLAMHGRDWNDDRPRTVFAMPDTHLVLKLHQPDNVLNIEDELYEGKGKLEPVNELYYHTVMFLGMMNDRWGSPWFKSVSVMEVLNDVKTGEFSQKLTLHMNANYTGTYFEVLHRGVTTDQDLLDFLREQEAGL